MKRVISVLKSVFFPKTCAGCGEIINEDDELCDYCHEMPIDIRVPVTLKAQQVRKMCEGRLEDENGRIEVIEIGDPLFFPRQSPLVEALFCNAACAHHMACSALS